VLLSVLLCRVFPRFELPAPSGTHAIGTEELWLVDAKRLEGYTAEPDDARELRVRITYPADAASGLPRDTVRGTASIALVGALTLGWPAAADLAPLSWGPIPTHALRSAPVAAAQPRYPVLIFSHGLASSPGQNTTLIEELASHGYVVMAIQHGGLSADSQRADGSLLGTGAALRQLFAPLSEEQSRKMRELFEELGQVASVDARIDVLRRQAEVRPELTQALNAMHALASQDQRFVLDQLERLQASDPILAGHLDLDRIGVFGMSLGGTASTMTCAFDRRCRAGLNLDGFHQVLLDLPPLQVPFLLMSAERHLNHEIPHEQSLATSYVARIAGTVHLSFTDLGLAMPVLSRRGNSVGSIAPQRITQLTREYARAFFDQSLRGMREPLLDGPSAAYPEVTLLIRNASQQSPGGH
jgi:predicted dienelactone hydrolase